ncbi:uncharacterized protein SCHCODRAFT_02645312, partial [Schizophyllum commune H4-8]|uniref:uncharacterized protein n=1 Tax=Schizophyllum commune (strain H4-8 / FGSC 9210) TaxID=578458 RepID=UPI00216031F2
MSGVPSCTVGGLPGPPLPPLTSPFPSSTRCRLPLPPASKLTRCPSVPHPGRSRRLFSPSLHLNGAEMLDESEMDDELEGERALKAAGGVSGSTKCPRTPDVMRTRDRKRTLRFLGGGSEGENGEESLAEEGEEVTPLGMGEVGACAGEGMLDMEDVCSIMQGRPAGSAGSFREM